MPARRVGNVLRFARVGILPSVKGGVLTAILSADESRYRSRRGAVHLALKLRICNLNRQAHENDFSTRQFATVDFQWTNN